MQVGNVSFGSAAFVFGSPNAMQRFSAEISRQTAVSQRDAADYYSSSISPGIMSNLAKSGHSIKLFITGSDVKKVMDKEPGWRSVEEILLQRPISVFLDNKKLFSSPEDAAKKLAAISK